jgi:hypothetical protein
MRLGIPMARIMLQAIALPMNTLMALRTPGIMLTKRRSRRAEAWPS